MTSLVSFDNVSREFTFDEQSDLSLTEGVEPYYKDYVLTVTAAVGSFTVDNDIALKVHNPCIDPVLSTITTPADLTLTYVVQDPAVTIRIADLAFTSSLEICGDITKTVVTGISDPVSYDALTDLLTIYSTDTSLADTSVLLTVDSHLTDYPDIVGDTMTIIVDITAIAAEEEVVNVYANSPPLFDNALPSNITYNYTEIGTLGTVDLTSLGSISDFEGDAFTVEFSGAQSFI